MCAQYHQHFWTMLKCMYVCTISPAHLLTTLKKSFNDLVKLYLLGVSALFCCCKLYIRSRLRLIDVEDKKGISGCSLYAFFACMHWGVSTYWQLWLRLLFQQNKMALFQLGHNFLGGCNCVLMKLYSCYWSKKG